MDEGFEIVTPRLRLRPWRLDDADDFALMNADPEVMADLGGPLARAESDAKLRRFQRSFEVDRITRWVVVDREHRFVGYCGLVEHVEEHPLGPHHDIGWRLTRTAWGQGYATEAASAALDDAFDRLGVTEVFAYTAPDNSRSQAVMRRLGLERRESLDFTSHFDDTGMWTGLVWSTSRHRHRGRGA